MWIMINKVLKMLNMGPIKSSRQRQLALVESHVFCYHSYYIKVVVAEPYGTNDRNNGGSR